MKLIHDNDLVNVSAGMESKADVYTDDSAVKCGARAVLGAIAGYIVGDMIGTYIGADQSKEYVLSKGEEASPVVSAVINKSVNGGCSLFGTALGFLIGLM